MTYSQSKTRREYPYFVAQPGTPQAETCIAYYRPGEEQEGILQ